MSKQTESKSVDQLLAEADELMRQIHSDALEDMAETHRIQFGKHAENLKKIKSEVQGGAEKKGTSGAGSGAEGMHQALQDIVKAMHNFKKNLF